MTGASLHWYRVVSNTGYRSHRMERYSTAYQLKEQMNAHTARDGERFRVVPDEET